MMTDDESLAWSPDFSSNTTMRLTFAVLVSSEMSQQLLDGLTGNLAWRINTIVTMVTCSFIDLAHWLRAAIELRCVWLDTTLL